MVSRVFPLIALIALGAFTPGSAQMIRKLHNRRSGIQTCGSGVFFFFPGGQPWSPHTNDISVLSDLVSLVQPMRSIYRGRKRHINVWHINNFSVTPVTDPPGRVPESSRPGTRSSMFMFLGFHTQHINFWSLASGRETPGHPVGRPPPHSGSHRKNLFMFMCLFLSWI